MSKYRLLQDHYINNVLLPAGSVVTDVGAGAQLPSGWIPSPNVDPLDSDALSLFYAQGPVLGSAKTQFSTAIVTPAATYWKSIGGGFWQLMGLGANLAPVWAWRI